MIGWLGFGGAGLRARLIRSATMHWWRRKSGTLDLVMIPLLTVGFLGYVLFSGDLGWEVGAFGALIGMVWLAWIAAFVVVRGRAMQKLNKMGEPTAEVRISEEGIQVRSGAGTAEVPWRMIEQVWRYPDAWLIFIGRDNYFTLPMAGIDAATQEFICRRVTESGGRCR